HTCSYTLSLHDALPILGPFALAVNTDVAVVLANDAVGNRKAQACAFSNGLGGKKRIEYFFQVGFGNARPIVRHDDQHLVRALFGDRKSTRLNSSHVAIS